MSVVSPMQAHEALRDAPAFLRNAQEIASRDPINAETLYMWDNQVTAIEGFLVETEDFDGSNPDLSKARRELFQLKKTIEGKVLAFELKQENAEMPPEPSEAELVEDMTAYGAELQDLVKDITKANPKSLKDLQELEEPRQQIANFLVETEPLKGKGKKLDEYRAAVKKCKVDLDARMAAALKAARAQEASEPDEDD